MEMREEGYERRTKIKGLMGRENKNEERGKRKNYLEVDTKMKG